MWICIFDNEYTRIWLCEYVQLVMSGYGHDESVPYAWRSVLQPISWWTWGIGECFAANFVVDVGNWRGVSHSISWVLRKHSPNVRHVFAICLIYIRKMFATYWLSVCYILTEQKGGFCIAKVWFLACKKGIFDGQK